MAAVEQAEEGQQPERESGRRRGRWLRNPSFVIGGCVAVLMVVVCFGAPLFTHYNPVVQNPSATLQPPSAAHLMGTDQFGEDMLARVLYGGRYSILAGVVAVLMGTAAGTIIGITAGFAGGLVDFGLMRCVDFLMAFPGILLALTVSAILGPGLTNAVLAIAISSVPAVARVVEGVTLQARAFAYVEAAGSLGASRLRAMARHILPNIMSQVIVLGTTGLGGTVLAVAALGFLGLGLQPPTPEWGAILNQGQDYVTMAWWIPLFPGVFITIFVVSVNLLGDGLRDLLDPILSGK